MGTVYLAGRTKDTFEQIKIVRNSHSRTSDEKISRFEREQRILAGFNQPGIARLSYN